MYKHRILLFFVVFFLSATSSSYSLPADFDGKSFVINFNKSDYTGGNQNWSVDVDASGIVYIGNNQGLLKFDGANWDIFHMPDDMVVRSVAAGDSGKIYVGAFEEFGFFSMNSQGFFDYTSLSIRMKKVNLHNDEIWRIVIHKGKVYFQSFSHIYVYNGESVKVIDPGGTIVLLMEARERMFVHKVGDGLYEMKDDSLFPVRGSEILAGDEVKTILPFGKSAFLVGSSSAGLFVMDGKTFRPLEKPVNALIRESEVNNGITLDSLLIIGTIVDGIFILNPDGSLREHLNTDNFLQNNTVLALRSVKNHSFWAGLDRGVDFITLDNPLSFYMDPSRNRRTVFAGALTGDTLWVGTNQGVFRYLDDPSTGYSHPEIVDGTQGQVWDLSVIDGELICGHTNGTFRIINGKPQRISAINGGYAIRKFGTFRGDILLQSSYSVFSVYKRSGSEWTFSHVIPGFYEPVPVFEADHSGYIWASHASKGLYRLRFDAGFTRVESARYFGKKEGLPSERHIMVANVDNRVVFCTRKKIYTYNDLADTIVPFESLNRELGGFAASDRIVAMGNDKYWCIAGNSVALFRIYNGNARRIFSYDLSLQGASLGSGQGGIYILKKDLYLICLDNGFALYHERDSAATYAERRPLITMVRASDRRKRYYILPAGEKRTSLDLPYSFGNVEFYISSDQVCVDPVFSYRLSGFDNLWSDWSGQSKIMYTRLPAGEYRFAVKTLGGDGNSSDPVTFSLRIKRPWYASIAALIVYTCLFFALLLFFRILFTRRLMKHTIRMQTLEKEKRYRDKVIAEQDIIRLKNEKLQSEVSHKNIQLANYTMTILKKNELLIKIKDAINAQKKELGGRYPNYHYDKLVRLIDSNLSSEDDWRIFEMHFDQAHENFFMRLKASYAELTPSDLKLCAYLRLNLSSKEIAPLLNISVRGIEIRRYRLRKHLLLNTQENLVEFLMNF